MRWPSWDQALLAAAGAFATALALARWTSLRSGSGRVSALAAFLREFALVSGLYALWRLARQLPLVQEAGAYERARWIWDVQRTLRLPSELAMERFAMDHAWLAEVTVTYYATAHVPSLLLFLLWLWVRHRDQYPRWRNALAITTGMCLLIRFVRVAPPRLLPELGFVDLPAALGRDIYGPVGTGASDQFAAMPSIHVAWAVIVGLGIWSAAGPRWRWIGPLHIVLTFWAVMATANHWWLDGLVAVGLVWGSLAIDGALRRVAARRRAVEQAPDETSSVEDLVST
jgi:hypothetical protein